MAKRKQRKQKRPSKNKTAAFLLFGFGLLIFLLGTLTHATIYYRYIITTREHPKELGSSSTPTHISLPNEKIEVNVDQGGIVSGEWVLSGSNALYLPTSGMLGEGFNTIIYAHNTDKLFGRLKEAKHGDLILLNDKTGKTYKYKIYYIKDVEPTDVASLYAKDKDVVTLFTCDGWFDKTRLIVRAKLVK